MTQNETFTPEEDEAVDYDAHLESMTKAELVEECRARGEVLDAVWNEGIIASDNDELSDANALEEVADILNEHDPVRFPLDDDDEAEEEPLAA